MFAKMKEKLAGGAKRMQGRTDLLEAVCASAALVAAADGSIDLTVTGGTSPYSFSWSTGATTEDVAGLAAGTYTYTVTDDAGCEVTADVEINNDAGDLSIDGIDITNENCDDDGGAIDITVGDI